LLGHIEAANMKHAIRRIKVRMELYPMLPGSIRGGGIPGVTMSDTDRLHTLAEVCVKAAHKVEDTEVAAMLLDSAQRFLERANPDLARSRTDIQAFNRSLLYAGSEHDVLRGAGGNRSQSHWLSGVCGGWDVGSARSARR
jgi:hypothetical protein